MAKTVLDVGNCGPDHMAISRMLQNQFEGIQVRRADGLSDTLSTLQESPVDLILVNRKLDYDYSDGIEILKHLKSDAQFRDIPVMLITNFEEHQASAIEAGALRGFGKLQLDSPDTTQRLADILG